MLSEGSADGSTVKVAFTVHTESFGTTIVRDSFGDSMSRSPTVLTHDLNL